MNPSDLVDSRYRLERLLGTGGMSEVWLAEDERLGRKVAVKVLRPPGGSESRELLATLEREARLIARLQHPNIVGVYDAGEFEGQRYLVMEYVDGPSLRELLGERGRIAEPEAVRYGVEVARALEYAHGVGVIHCDVKPENVLITSAGVAKVADFGVAETIARTLAPAEAREILGTIAYLAPEVLQGAQADARSDVYSLGLTIYEAVAGRLPFAGTTPAAVAGQRLAMAAPPLRTFSRGASAGLESVLAQALAPNPADRYESARALGRALSGAGAAPVTAAPRPARPAPGGAAPPRRHETTLVRRSQPPPVRRDDGNPALVAAIVLSVVIALAAVAFAAAVLFAAGGDDDDDEPTPGHTSAPTTPAATTPTRGASPTSRPTDEPTATPTPSSTPTPPAATNTPAPATNTVGPIATATRTPTP